MLCSSGTKGQLAMQIYSETSVAVQSASEHQESLSESSVAVQWASGPLQTTANTQFAKPQMHILQSNRSVQSTAETSCPPCSVAVALRAIGDASLFRDQLPAMLCSSGTKGTSIIDLRLAPKRLQPRCCEDQKLSDITYRTSSAKPLITLVQGDLLLGL